MTYTVDDKLHYQDSIKYQVARQWEWKLVGNFKIKSAFYGKWYALVRRADGWYLVAYPGCGWDGATWFPDFKWVMQASLGHDILHWLIARGIIDESDNDLIDDEMIHIIRARAQLPIIAGKTVMELRAFYIKRAISLVNQSVAPVHPILIV